MSNLAPRNAAMCCAFLHLEEGSPVHQSIVRGILQVTGFGKQFVKPDGQIPPRTPNGDFSPAFRALVERFLENMKGGILFFFDIPPSYKNWDTSFKAFKRFIWKVKGDKESIRQGMLLLFEDLKLNPNRMSLEDAEIFKTFVSEDCDLCGSGDGSDPNNDIVYCETCKCGFHQQCAKG